MDVHSAREMVGLLKGMRDAGKTIFVVTHQAPLLEGVADEFVWMQEGQIVERTSEPELQTGGDAMNSLRSITLATLDEGHSSGVAFPRCDQLHAVLFAAGGGDLQFLFRSPGGGVAPKCGGLIWVAFLFAAVVALNQTWARELRNQVLDAYRVSPAPANALFLAKALGNFILVSLLEAVMAPLFMIFYNLRALGPAWQLIPVASSGDVGAGGERDFFRGDVVAYAQPGNHAAAVVVSDLDSGRAVDGGGYAHHPRR